MKVSRPNLQHRPLQVIAITYCRRCCSIYTIYVPCASRRNVCKVKQDENPRMSFAAKKNHNPLPWWTGLSPSEKLLTAPLAIFLGFSWRITSRHCSAGNQVAMPLCADPSAETANTVKSCKFGNAEEFVHDVFPLPHTL